MGTLYECLREARLEKYYPAFRANGITRSESLANLTMPEFCAMGISGAEDRRRLVELVNIIKSVHRGQHSNGSAAPVPVPRKRQPESPTQNSTRQTGGAASAVGSSTSQSDKKVPRRHPRSPEGAVGGPNAHTSGMRLEPTRDVSVRERGPNFSVASYLEMLDFMSDSSQSDSGEMLSQSQDNDTGAQPTQAVAPAPAPTFSNKVPRRASPAERVRPQTRSKGYNYGVPSNVSGDSVKPKVRASGRSSRDDKIRVCVRKRPLSRRESRAADPDIVEAGSTTSVTVKEPKVSVDLTAFTMKHEFVFDEVFDETCSNEDVYIRAARPLISTVFQRCNATFFAYGQTGAGKTHTMLGGNGVPGLYQLAAQDVFDIIASGQYGADLHVWVSFFEIYCGQLFDLLNKRNRLVAREDGSQRVCIAGLTETEVPDVDTLIRVLQYGNSVRSRGTSGVNPDSSRSHAVLQMEIRHEDEEKLGKISFIDLAGSERACDMGDPDRQTRMEGAEINQSLLALKECIRSIDQESRHTPFRQSKLTHILKDAFVGNSRTCMIANLSPGQSACEHTLNTLRYADRVKELRRESSQSGTGVSLGHAMNLLMNIPITAPSIFHPSNVLSTSTPVRPHLSRQHQPTSSAADITFDPAETPIRGHNVPLKSASKVRPRPRSDGPAGYDLNSQSANKRRWQPHKAWQSEAAASQGALLPHPEASPSESDHTDTDSNNVTHPTETRPAPSQPNIPVIGSTDTEFDFPTSDFNNIDDHLNDLNQGRNDLNRARELQGSEGREPSKDESGRGQPPADEASAASASGPRSEPQRSQVAEGASPRSAVTNPLLNRANSHSQPLSSPSPAHRQSSVSPAPGSKQSKNSQNMAEKFPASPAPSSHASRRGVHSAQPKTTANEPGATSQPAAEPLTDSFDDELLFAGPGDSEGPKPEVQESSHSGNLSGARLNRHVMNVLPAVLTALSSDLTSFAQRSPLRNGGDKTAADQGRGDDSAVDPCPNPTALPCHTEKPATTAGSPREPAAPRKSQIPSPRKAAIRDWVAQTGDQDAVLARGERERAGSQLEKMGSGFARDRNQAHADYRLAGNSPRNQLSGQERQRSRTGVQSTPRLASSDAEDSPASARADPHPGLSGPSSDPVTPNHSTPSADSAKSNQYQHSNSLPSQSIPANVKQDRIQESHSRNTVSDNPSTTSVSPFTTTKATASSALVTEKLLSGAVFSPIHPQPVSASATRTVITGQLMRGTASYIIQPKPVAGIPSELTGPSVTSPAAFSIAERDEARVSLVGSHEDQLAAITSLCKQEMKLLLNAKKAVPRSFDDYMNRVSGILAQKMSAIQLLQGQIKDYQERFCANRHPRTTP